MSGGEPQISILDTTLTPWCGPLSVCRNQQHSQSPRAAEGKGTVGNSVSKPKAWLAQQTLPQHANQVLLHPSAAMASRLSSLWLYIFLILTCSRGQNV